MTIGSETWYPWLWSGGVLLAAAAAALAVHYATYTVLQRTVSKTGVMADNSLVVHTRRPTMLAAPLLAVLIADPLLAFPDGVQEIVLHAARLGLIGAGAWFVVGVTEALGDIVTERYRVDIPDNLGARQVRTQMQVIRRVVSVAAGLGALALMLATFPSMRHVGVSLFASAGVAGLVIGMAARPAISNLIAGMQIAFTQPIRLDDVVIVEGEWGRIEEITTTYVVVKIWDKRRLVVPISYFNEHPFENWTRIRADLLGTVELYADYTVPVEEVRQKLHQLLQESDLWDGEAWGLQVTETTERTMKLRALMSAPDAGAVWDLRCQIREQLISYLQEAHPGCLPRARAEIAGRLPDGSPS